MRLLNRLWGHKFREIYWPDLEPGGHACGRCGVLRECECPPCRERWAKLRGKG